MSTLTTEQIQEANLCKSRLHQYMRILEDKRAREDTEGEERVQEQISVCRSELAEILGQASRPTPPTPNREHAQRAANRMHEILGPTDPPADGSKLDSAARDKRFAWVGRMTTNPPGGSDKSQSSHRRNILHDVRGTEGSHPQINRQSEILSRRQIFASELMPTGNQYHIRGPLGVTNCRDCDVLQWVFTWRNVEKKVSSLNISAHSHFQHHAVQQPNSNYLGL